jgi:hypothetical protein
MDTEEMVTEEGFWNHKHHAVIAVGVLIAVFLLITLGYWLYNSHSAPVTPLTDVQTATTTPVATTAPETQGLSIVEHAAYYDIDAKYPASAGLSGSADSVAVALMKKFETTAIAQFKSDGNFANLTPADIKMQNLDQNKYSLGIEYTTYRGARTVSYAFQVYADTGGAHGNTYFQTFTFDTVTGKQLHLQDLFTAKSAYLTLLSKQSAADLPGIIRNMNRGNEPDASSIAIGTKAEPNNFQAFVIDGSSLKIIFAPYQVGPYSLGVVIDPIPLATFKAVLLPVYLP